MNLGASQRQASRRPHRNDGWSNVSRMAIDDSPSFFFSPWPDRLRHAAIILLAAALALSAVVVLGELSMLRAAAIFGCIAAAALVPWRLHDATMSREDV